MRNILLPIIPTPFKISLNTYSFIISAESICDFFFHTIRILRIKILIR